VVFSKLQGSNNCWSHDEYYDPQAQAQAQAQDPQAQNLEISVLCLSRIWIHPATFIKILADGIDRLHNTKETFFLP